MLPRHLIILERLLPASQSVVAPTMTGADTHTCVNTKQWTNLCSTSVRCPVGSHAQGIVRHPPAITRSHRQEQSNRRTTSPPTSSTTTSRPTHKLSYTMETEDTNDIHGVFDITGGSQSHTEEFGNKINMHATALRGLRSIGGRKYV